MLNRSRMAVYTKIDGGELNAFVSSYDIGGVLACEGIAEGIENTNYRLSTEGGVFILTLYEKRVNPDDLPFFLGLLDHLSARGVPCPVPLKDRAGKALKTLSGRPASMVTFLEGAWPRRVSPDHCALLGGAMARMHVAGRDFTQRRDNDMSLSSWPGLFAPSAGRADEVRPGLAAEISAELDFLEARWPRPDGKKGLLVGVIHGDLFPDNVFFRDGKVSGLIDFYFACTDVLAYDLAVCLNAWCFESDYSFNITKASRLLRAYGKVREFPETERDALPVLARGAALRFLLTRLHDWLNRPQGALVTPKNPLEYYEKLKFHRAVSGPADYGLG